MNLRDTGRLLAVIQIADNRRVDELTISEWHHDLAEVNIDDAIAVARAHRVSSGEYLTVRHIRDGVKKIRNARLEGVDDIDPPPHVAEGSVQDYLDWKRQLIREVADGTYVPEPAKEVGTRTVGDLRALLKRPDDLPPVPGEDGPCRGS